MQIVMTQRYLKALEFTKQNEGGFTNNPHDKGGETIYGVSSKWFPEVYKELTEAKPEEVDEILKAFYYAEFYDMLYEQIFYEPIAIRLFDLGVNLSKKKATKLLQQTFNKLSQVRIGEDGKFGNGTLKAINMPPIAHEQFYLSYQKEVEQYYRSLPDFTHFGAGWISRLYRDIPT